MVGVGGATRQVDLGIPGYGPGVFVGRGGFATVYRAVQASSGGQVAVKVLSGHLDEQAESRFERETTALGKLRGHPNICTVYDAGTNDEGRPYLVMEYAERGSMAQRLVARGPLSWPEALEVGVKLAGALETAHRARLLHRDVKPENVLVTDYGEVRLADFGLARFTDDSASRGGLTATLAHTAPELLGDDPPSVASDVYALGSTLFQMLRGQTAFASSAGGHVGSLIRRIEQDPVPDLGPEVPDQLADVVRTAMAKDPAQRYPTAAAMGGALQDLQRAHQLPVTPLPLRVEDPGTEPPARPVPTDPPLDPEPVPPTTQLPPRPPTPTTPDPGNETRKVERPNRDRPEPPSDTADTDEIESEDVDSDNGTSRRRPGRRVLVAAGGVVALIATVVIGFALTADRDGDGDGDASSIPGKSSQLPPPEYDSADLQAIDAAARKHFDVLNRPEEWKCTKNAPQPPLALSYECAYLYEDGTGGRKVLVLYADDGIASTTLTAQQYVTTLAAEEATLGREGTWSSKGGAVEGKTLSFEKKLSGGFAYAVLWNAAPSWALISESPDEDAAASSPFSPYLRMPKGENLSEVDASTAR